MGAKNQTPAAGIGDLTTKYGLVPSLSGGLTGDPNDLPVFTGRTQRDLRSEYVTAGVAPGRIPKALPAVPATVSTKRQSEMERDFYGYEPGSSDLKTLQKRLYAGGFYAAGVDPNGVILGVHDEQTFAAFQKAVGRAASYYSAGKEYTVDDVLDMAAGAWGQGKGGAGGRGGGGGAGGRQPLTVDLTSPDDLSAVAQATAVRTIGRALRPDELSRFVSSFHTSQRQEQTATAGEVVGAPAAATAAATFVRGAAPVESGANDVVKVYGSLSRILSRRG